MTWKLPTLCWIVATSAPPASALADDPDASAALRERLATVEARLDRIDRKFELLAADDADELLDRDEVFADPKLLIALAEHALEQEDLAKGYRYLSLIHILHPASEENDRVFADACRLFRKNWFFTRYTDPQSIWHTSEPAFMFQWLAAYFSEDGAFPKDRAEALLVGMPQSFSRTWADFARTRPKLARFPLEIVEDNGIVRSLRQSERE